MGEISQCCGNADSARREGEGESDSARLCVALFTVLSFGCDVQGQSVQYWPSTKNDVEKYGDFTIELIEEGSFEDYVARDLKIVEMSVSCS